MWRADRAWRTGLNGVKRESFGDIEGYFGVVNLLGPRDPRQRPYDQFWHMHFTYVQLRYELIDSSSGGVYQVDRTYMTFYDFDTGISQVVGAVPAIETMQMGPQASNMMVRRATEIQREPYATWFSMQTAEVQADVATTMLARDPWQSMVNFASVYGVGDDNPANPMDLTELQAHRSVMAEFEQMSSFQIRYALAGCCTTGRNFLFGGCARSARPLACACCMRGVRRTRTRTRCALCVSVRSLQRVPW